MWYYADNYVSSIFLSIFSISSFNFTFDTITILSHHTKRHARGPPDALLGRQTRAPSRERAAGIHWLPPSDELVAAIELDLDGAADFEGADGGPDAPLAVQDPIVQALLCGRLEESEEVARGQVGGEGEAGAGDRLVDEEAADRGREHA